MRSRWPFPAFFRRHLAWRRGGGASDRRQHSSREVFGGRSAAEDRGPKSCRTPQGAGAQRRSGVGGQGRECRSIGVARCAERTMLFMGCGAQRSSDRGDARRVTGARPATAGLQCASDGHTTGDATFHPWCSRRCCAGATETDHVPRVAVALWWVVCGWEARIGVRARPVGVEASNSQQASRGAILRARRGVSPRRLIVITAWQSMSGERVPTGTGKTSGRTSTGG